MIKTLKKINHKKTLTILIIIAIPLSFATSTVYANVGASFTDVQSGHWVYEYVENLYNKEIIIGYGGPDNKFKPNNDLTRRHAAKMIAKAARLNYAGKKTTFVDVELDDEMVPYIGALQELGAVKGDNGKFKPLDSITRRQISQMVVKAFNIKKGENPVYFSDKLTSYSETQEYIDILASNGIVKGYKENGKDLFKPNNNVTRAQFAKIISVSMAVSGVQKAEESKTQEAIDEAQKLINSLPNDSAGETTKRDLQTRLNVFKPSEVPASTFINKVKALPSIAQIELMDLTSLTSINTEIELARTTYVSLSDEAKKDENIISWESKLSKVEDALYNTYSKKASHGNKKITITRTNYNQTLIHQLIKQINSSAPPQTDAGGGGWKNANEDQIKYYLDPNNFVKRQLGMGTVNTSSGALNMRSQPNTSSDIIDKLGKGESYPVLDEKNGWYKIEAKGKTGWVSSNYIKFDLAGNDSMYQFLDLSKSTNVNPMHLSMFLQDKGTLEGQGSAFAKAGQTHNINEIYLLAHAIHETGHGKSKLAVGVLVDRNGRIFDKNYRYVNSKGQYVGVDGKVLASGKTPIKAQGPFTIVYNMYGIGAYDSDPVMYGAKRAFDEGWTSPDAGIIGGAKFVSTNYIQSSTYKQNTLYKMRWNPANLSKSASHQYATDVGWADKQVKSISKYYNEISDCVLHFDIPVYKIDPIGDFILESATKGAIILQENTNPIKIKDDEVESSDEVEIETKEENIETSDNGLSYDKIDEALRFTGYSDEGEYWLVNIVIEEEVIHEIDSLLVDLYSKESLLGQLELTQDNYNLEYDNDSGQVHISFYVYKDKDIPEDTDLSPELLRPDKIIITFELDGVTHTVKYTDIID